VDHLVSPKDLTEKGLSKLILAHLWMGAPTNLDILRIPDEWCATLPPMQHYHPEYYNPENKPNFPAPAPKDLLSTAPPVLPEYAMLCRAVQPTQAYWSNISYGTRSQSGYPTLYLESVVQAISGVICLNHSSVGDPQEINVLKLHGTAYSQSLGVSSTPPNPTNRPGYPVLANCQIVAGGLVWGSAPRTNPLPCNPHLLSALLKTLKHNSWCQVLVFGDCFVPSSSEDDILTLFADVCRTNTTLLSISFPPRAVDATPILPRTGKYQLWARIGDALLSNPRPLFSSIDFTNCHLGDEGVRALLPGLARLFSHRNTLASLKFNGNNLSAIGIAMICESLLASDSSSPFFHLTELSFGGNPWCANPNTIPVQLLNAVVRLSPHLQTLDLEATDGVFPIQLMKFDLLGSSCPLVDLAVGGFRLAPGGVCTSRHSSIIHVTPSPLPPSLLP
jgi:hypothetical protein